MDFRAKWEESDEAAKLYRSDVSLPCWHMTLVTFTECQAHRDNPRIL